VSYVEQELVNLQEHLYLYLS